MREVLWLSDACRLFALAKEEHGSAAAMSFLFDLSAQVHMSILGYRHL